MATQQVIWEHHEVFEFHICEAIENIKSDGIGKIRASFQVCAFFFKLKKLQGGYWINPKVQPHVAEGIIKASRSIWYLQCRRVHSKRHWSLQELGYIHFQLYGSKVHLKSFLYSITKKVKIWHEWCVHLWDENIEKLISSMSNLRTIHCRFLVTLACAGKLWFLTFSYFHFPFPSISAISFPNIDFCAHFSFELFTPWIRYPLSLSVQS